MNYTHNLLLYHTITPLHVGCGQDVGVVDLPVIRERTTGYPYLPGSGTRGALRAAYSDEIWRDRLFGPEGEGEGGVRHAGSVSVHDAKLLLLPVRSSPHVYVWITSPTALRRLGRDLAAFELGLPELAPDLDALLQAVLGADQFLGPSGITDGGEGGLLYLEEYAYRPVADGEAVTRAREELERWSSALAVHIALQELPARTVLVSDPAFHHFCHFATVVQQHNKLTSAKTVAGTALFSLEAVPPETVFYGLIGGTAARWESEAKGRLDAAAVLSKLRKGFVPNGGKQFLTHLGGGESTGLGVTRLVWQDGGEPHAH